MGPVPQNGFLLIIHPLALAAVVHSVYFIIFPRRISHDTDETLGAKKTLRVAARADDQPVLAGIEMPLKVEVARLLAALVHLARENPLTRPRLNPDTFVARLGMNHDERPVRPDVAPTVPRKDLEIVPRTMIKDRENLRLLRPRLVNRLEPRHGSRKPLFRRHLMKNLKQNFVERYMKKILRQYVLFFAA